MLKMFSAVKVAAAAMATVGGGLVFLGAAGMVAGARGCIDKNKNKKNLKN